MLAILEELVGLYIWPLGYHVLFCAVALIFADMGRTSAEALVPHKRHSGGISRGAERRAPSESRTAFQPSKGSGPDIAAR